MGILLVDDSSSDTEPLDSVVPAGIVVTTSQSNDAQSVASSSQADDAKVKESKLKDSDSKSRDSKSNELDSKESKDSVSRDSKSKDSNDLDSKASRRTPTKAVDVEPTKSKASKPEGAAPKSVESQTTVKEDSEIKRNVESATTASGKQQANDDADKAKLKTKLAVRPFAGGVGSSFGSVPATTASSKRHTLRSLRPDTSKWMIGFVGGDDVKPN